MVRRSKALALLFVLLTFLGSTSSWHAADDDADFLPPAGHDHGAHHERFRTRAASIPPSHCALCHWLQAFRTGRAAQADVQFVSEAPGALHIASANVARSAVLFQRSPRGPPA